MASELEVNPPKAERPHLSFHIDFAYLIQPQVKTEDVPRLYRLQSHVVPKALVAFCFRLLPPSPPSVFQPMPQCLEVRIVATELRALEGTLSDGRATFSGYLECAQGLLSPKQLT